MVRLQALRLPGFTLPAILALALLFANPAQACYSGLIIIPTTDVTGPYTFALDIQYEGSTSALRTEALLVNTEFGPLRVHLGLQHESDEHHNNAFLGVDHVFENGWQVMADHTRGDNNFTSAGAGRSGKAWGLFLGSQWPNAGGPGRAVVHLTWTVPLPRKK